MTTGAPATDALTSYFSTKLGAPAGVSIQEVRRLAGGWSRLTYLIDVSVESSTGMTSRRLVVRVKPPAGLLQSDIQREYEVLSTVHEHGLPVPRPLWSESDGAGVFEGPFYVSEEVEGGAPNTWKRSDRQGLERDWDEGRGLAEQFVTHLASIHLLPVGDFEFLGPPRHVDEIVDRWTDVYESVRLIRDPVIEEGFSVVRQQVPSAQRIGLVHGDYRIGNLLCKNQEIRAILDWELAYLGDPIFDLGYCSLDYVGGRLLTAGSPLASGVCEREWLFERYEMLTGQRVDREAVRLQSALAALILMVILLTGVRAFHDGRSHDIRLAWGRYPVAGLRESVIELLDRPAR